MTSNNDEGRLDELLDEIYQDKNTLGDLPLDRDLAKAAIQKLLIETRIDELKRFTDFPYQAAVDENGYTGKEVVKDIERRLKTLQEGSSE
jgi:hypothetical protein